MSKYKRRGKKSNIEKGFDISILAEEYSELIPFRYTFILENDEVVVFRFNKERFYHLLGFHKMEDTTVFNLIDKETISKGKFFDEVKNKNIGYDFVHLDKFVEKSKLDKFKSLHTEGFKEVTYKETRFKSDLGTVISNRFKCFSRKTILDTFGNQVVVDYNSNDYESKIEADKVFYKLYKSADRNINFYVGKNEKSEYYPVTFFLETEKDSVRVKDDGNEQDHLDILCKIVRTADKDKEIDTVINWENVRKRFEGDEEYRGQNRLKMYFNDSNVYSSEVRASINEISKLIEEQESAIEIIECLLGKCIIYNEYIDANSTQEQRDEAILYFMELDIDIENIELVDLLDGRELSSVKDEFNKLKSKKEASQAKLKKYMQFLPLVEQLELKEVRFLYDKFFNTSKPIWTEGFVRQLITDGCYENKLSLDEIGNRVSEKPRLHQTDEKSQQEEIVVERTDVV